MTSEKLRDLAFYILERAGPMEFTKLSNIIYLADLEHYLQEGSTISGARHFKQPWGVEIEGLQEVVNG